MIVAAQILSALILAGWLYSLTIRVSGLLDRADEVYDRADQLLTTPAVGHQTWITTASIKDGEKPAPTPGPATVPTGQAIDAWAHSIGKHAAKGTK